MKNMAFRNGSVILVVAVVGGIAMGAIGRFTGTNLFEVYWGLPGYFCIAVLVLIANALQFKWPDDNRD